MSVRTYRYLKVAAFIIFSAVFSQTWMVDTVSAQYVDRAGPAYRGAPGCGVGTGNSNSWAGIIVDTYWRPYGTNQTISDSSANVRIENADSRGDDDSWGNIRTLRSGNTTVGSYPGKIGIDAGVFNQKSGCGDGRNMVLGYTSTSSRVDGDNGTGIWALDCDAHAPGYGLGNERWFRVTGSGTPAGARPGGTWEVKEFRAVNGYTRNVTLIYYEPAPPDQPPIGVFESATCSAISGWAFDRTNSSQSIQVHVQIDGRVPTSPVSLYLVANKPRPDVNAAYGIGGNHGFSADISSYVSDGGSHVIEPFMVNVGPLGSRIHSLGKRTVSGCRSYTLTPQVSPSSSSITVGQSATFTYRVHKSGPSAVPSTAVALKQYVVPPGQSFNASPVVRDNVTSNCNNAYSSSLCATTWQLPNRTFGGGSNTVTLSGASPAYSPIDTSGMAPGTMVCQILAVDAGGQNGTTRIRHRWSAPACITIAKKPYIAIKNGDAWAGGSLQSASPTCSVASGNSFTGTRTTFQDGRTYGTYGEYGIFGARGIDTFGSGARTAGSTLTFRSTPSPHGNFVSGNHCLNDALVYYGSQPPTLALGSSVNLSNLGSGVYTTTASTTTITSGNISANRHIVLIANNHININANITFAPGPYTNISQIPSVVVISRTGSIRVSQNVTQLDGFYQAAQDFLTCRERPTGGIGDTSGGPCRNQLTVNGAVTAGSDIVARRIHGGSGSLRDEPAEQFIMRPDIFLSQYGQSQGSGQLRTVDEIELPPRY